MDAEQAARIYLENQREKLLAAIEPQKSASGAENPGPFLNFLRIVKTKDEKDEGRIKPFPVHKEYLIDLASKFVQERLLLVKKSRQMVISWLACAYSCWRASSRPNQLVLWQSKNLEDAAEMVFAKDDPVVARSSFICLHLPRWAFEMPRGSYGRLVWPNGSQMIAIQQGADVIRSKAASLIISDEMGFQEEAAQAYTAARPAVSGGGQFIGISSANPGFFWEAAEDLFDASASPA